MRLDTEFIRLPFRFDAARLQEEVEQFTEDDWRPHPQGFEGNSALPFIAAGGDPNSDDVRGPMRPTPHLDRCPYLKQVLSSFESRWGRTRLMRIAPSYQANAHYDSNYYWQWRVRLHVPIVTHPKIDFLCADKTVHMAAGESWIFDTWKRHNVLNNSDITRIHLVADTVGSPAFWKIVQQSERPSGETPKLLMPPKHIAFDPNLNIDLPTEDTNFPVILSPQEQHKIRLLIEDEMAHSTALPAEAVAVMKTFLDEFLGTWRAVWDQHGPEESGWAQFESLVQQAQPKAQSMLKPEWVLPNGASLLGLVRDTYFAAGVNTHLRKLYQASGIKEPGLEEWRATQLTGQASVPPAPAPASVSAAPVGAAPISAAPNTPQPATGAQMPGQQQRPRLFDRPVFILAAPRSGSTMLFEALTTSPDAFTVGGESHQLIESIPSLTPEANGFHSNYLDPALATEAVSQRLRRTFYHQLRDASGKRPAPNKRIRLIEKTPKNALRVQFLNAVFPDALFIHLYREPRPNLGGIIDAWESGKFVTYPELEGWSGAPWSLLLTEGWRELNGKAPAQIAAQQWATSHQAIARDLDQIEPERWTAVRYEDILENPRREIERLCQFVGVKAPAAIGDTLPNSRYTLTAPNPDKWRRHEAQIEQAMPAIASEAAQTAQRISTRIEQGRSEPAPAPEPLSPAAKALRSVHTTSMTSVLQQLGISVAVSTYQAGKFVLLRANNDSTNTHFRQLPKPMGVTYDNGRLAVGSGSQILTYYAMKAGPKHQPADTLLMPRNAHITGDIDIHEMAWGDEGLWFVNTRFSCLCTLDPQHSFVPRWRPSFVSALAAEDRCHLNGLAMLNGKPRWVTALGETDTQGGWRENKASGGILIDVASQRIIARDLSMPHSPRFYRNKLWLLESGKGTLSTVHHETGEVAQVAELPGFTRGLSFVGNLAFIGLSQVRETAVFSGLPITQTTDERYCGIWVVNIDTGETVGFVRFEDAVQEIFAVEALPNMRLPDLLDWNDDALRSTYVLPQNALAEVAKTKVS